MEEEKICAKCLTPINKETIAHTKCNHFTHYKCLPLLRSYIEYFPNCNNCADFLDNTDEPRQYRGIDYVLDEKTVKCSPDIKKVLSRGHKISDLVFGYGYHLQRLLSMGVCIEDFLENGYTWKDLQSFRDLSEKNIRRRDALCALGCDANFYRENLKKLPWKEVFTSSREFIDYNDMHFVDGQGLISGNELWFAMDFVQMGVSFKKLVKYAGVNDVRLLRPEMLSQKQQIKWGLKHLL